MRILVAAPGPQYSVSDVCKGWVDALGRLGQDVQLFNLDDRLNFYSALTINDQHLATQDAITLASKGLEGKCYEFDPDVIVVVSGFFVPGAMWELWKQKRATTVLLCTESPYEDDKQVQTASAAQPDLVLINDPTNLDEYRRVHDATYYIPHSFDPAVHHPGVARPTVDFSFVGTGYPSRSEFFEAVDWSGIDAKFGGNWQALSDESPLRPLLAHPIEDCCDNADTVTLYQQSKVSANLYRAGRNALHEANRPDLAAGWAMGPREVELAACGTFFLREPRGEGDLILPMLPTFTEPGEFAEKLRYFLDHPKVRGKAAASARAAIQDRTFDAHAARMLRLLPN